MAKQTEKVSQLAMQLLQLEQHNLILNLGLHRGEQQ